MLTSYTEKKTNTYLSHFFFYHDPKWITVLVCAFSKRPKEAAITGISCFDAYL